MRTTQRPCTSALKCPPQLPRNLLRELSRNPLLEGASIAFLRSEYDDIRFKIALRAVSADLAGSLPVGGIPYHANLLHLAAIVGDLPLAYEMIRLGANIDGTDRAGLTPLFHAVTALYALDPETGKSLLLNNSDKHPNSGPLLKLVIRLLIEQHADVNIVWKNATCFTTLMCASYKHWDIIELLIAHGARVGMGSHNAYVLSKAEKERISELLRTRPSKRPPRPCPCFSGRLISDCHGKRPRPFPSHFICPCRSGSVYAKCCKKRKIPWRDIWNEERGIIEPWRKDLPVNLPMSQDATALLLRNGNEHGTRLPPAEIFRNAEDPPLAFLRFGLPSELDKWDVVEHHLDKLLKAGMVDPGFAFAMKEADWNARPLGRKIPEKYATDLAQIFNDFVDEYILSGRDPRKRIEIEIASKLGPSCGALYRVCEAHGCNQQEGHRIKKLKYCQRCRMAVYCSVKCQHAHWGVHRNVCCAPFQTEQPLPSQRALQESLSQMVETMCIHRRAKNLEHDQLLHPDAALELTHDFGESPL